MPFEFPPPSGSQKRCTVATVVQPVLLLPAAEARCASRYRGDDFRRDVDWYRGVVGEHRAEPHRCRAVGDAPRAQALVQLVFGVDRPGVDEPPDVLATDAGRIRRL